MNRRQLLAGVAALPLMSVPAIAAVKGIDDFKVVCDTPSCPYGINLLGMKVEYTKELAEDLVAVHGLHPVEIIEKMYGTEFRIEKEISLNNLSKRFLNFYIKTNDPRDSFTGWMVYVEDLGTPDGVHWKRFDGKGKKEWFRNWGHNS